jgi:DNA-binding transcriptional LysR family regulator
VGARLFHRVPQGATPTAAGRAFHDSVRIYPSGWNRRPGRVVARRGGKSAPWRSVTLIPQHSTRLFPLHSVVAVLHLVAAGLGVSLMAASLQALQVRGAILRAVCDASPITQLALAWRRADTSPFLINFLSSAFRSNP